MIMVGFWVSQLGFKLHQIDANLQSVFPTAATKTIPEVTTNILKLNYLGKMIIGLCGVNIVDC